MAVTFKIEMTILDSLSDMFKRQNYELLVLAVLNRSQTLISGLPLKYVEKQLSGESDYLDSMGGKYDAKLLFDSKQGALICDKK